MKILIISGHGAGDPGAVGNGYQEADLTREVTAKLVSNLKGYADVTLYPTSQNCYADLNSGKKVDFTPYDYVLEMHFNSYGDATANGTEVLYQGGTVPAVTNRIQTALSAYFTNRGVKKRTDLLVMNTCKNQGVRHNLVELCFISNKSDISVYQAKKTAICKAISTAIINVYKLTKTTTTTTTSTSSSAIKYAGKVNVVPFYNTRKLPDIKSGRAGSKFYSQTVYCYKEKTVNGVVWWSLNAGGTQWMPKKKIRSIKKW